MATVGIMSLSAIISEMSRNTSFRCRPSRNSIWWPSQRHL